MAPTTTNVILVSISYITFLTPFVDDLLNVAVIPVLLVVTPVEIQIDFKLLLQHFKLLLQYAHPLVNQLTNSVIDVQPHWLLLVVNLHIISIFLPPMLHNVLNLCVLPPQNTLHWSNLLRFGSEYEVVLLLWELVWTLVEGVAGTTNLTIQIDHIVLFLQEESVDEETVIFLRKIMITLMNG